MKLRTSELTGMSLNYAVILSLFSNPFESKPSILNIVKNYPYCTDWKLAGPIIEQEKITIGPGLTSPFVAHYGPPMVTGPWKRRYVGPTLLVVAMRCVVAEKIGDEIEIPEELL